MGAIGNKPKKFRTAETYDEPEMLADLDSIRKKAKEEGYVDGYKFDVEKFIKDKYPDIKILKVALSSDVSGKLEYKDGVWMMSVNLQHPEVRQRYTLGHELGHYLNHRDSVKSFEDTIYFRNSFGKEGISGVLVEIRNGTTDLIVEQNKVETSIV